MNPDAILDLMCGLFSMVSFLALAVQVTLLGPDRPNYRTASRSERAGLAALCAAMGCRGAELISLSGTSAPLHVPLWQFVGTVVFMAVQCLTAAGLLREWLPAKLRARVQRWVNIAKCGHVREVRNARIQQNCTPNARPGFTPGPINPQITATALAELSRQGVVVIAPMEGPEALCDEPFMPTGKP